MKVEQGRRRRSAFLSLCSLPLLSHLEDGDDRVREGARVQGDLDVALAGLDVDAGQRRLLFLGPGR